LARRGVVCHRLRLSTSCMLAYSSLSLGVKFQLSTADKSPIGRSCPPSTVRESVVARRTCAMALIPGVHNDSTSTSHSAPSSPSSFIISLFADQHTSPCRPRNPLSRFLPNPLPRGPPAPSSPASSSSYSLLCSSPRSSSTPPSPLSSSRRPLPAACSNRMMRSTTGPRLRVCNAPSSPRRSSRRLCGI
jgi:hypothetical protein